MKKVNDKLSEENLFWKMRDDITLNLRKKYNGKNIILDNNNIRPLTYNELNNKFAVSVEHADSGDFKTKEELEQIAKDINAEYIMFFPYEGKYGGEYSFLVKDEPIAKKIAKEYNQKAYAAFYEDDKENSKKNKEKNIDDLYHEILTPKEEKLNMKKPIKVRESVNCKNRKQLGKLIESLKNDNIKYKVNKSTDENFRYTISYSRVLNEEQNNDNNISFEDFLANAEVLIVDDAKMFDINQREKENEEEINEELGEESNTLNTPASKFIKYKLDDNKLRQVITKLKTSDFSMIDGRTSWKTRQFLKKNNLTLEDLKEVLRNIENSDYKINSKPIDANEGYNEAIVFIKDTKVKELGPLSLYIKLDYDSIEETPVVVISLHNDYQKNKGKEDKLKVKDANIVNESFDDLNTIAVNELKRKLKNVKGIEFTDEKPTGFSYTSNNKDKFWFECEVDEVISDKGKKLTEDANTEGKEEITLSYLFNLYDSSFAKVLSSKYPQVARELIDIAKKEEPMSKYFGATSLNEVKEPKLETFDEQMDFLAKDEQEAIDGYEKVLALVEDEHVKEQLNKILIEEEAHKEFLEKVKENKELVYEEPLPVEEEKPEEKEEVINEVEPLKEMYDDFVIEDKFIEYMKSKGIKNPKVFDKDGFFIDGVYEKYAQGVADTYLDGNIDWLDGLCNEERCFREDELIYHGGSLTFIENEELKKAKQAIKEETKEVFNNELTDDEIKEIINKYDYRDEIDLDDMALDCIDKHCIKNKIGVEAYSEEWNKLYSLYEKRVHELVNKDDISLTEDVHIDINKDTVTITEDSTEDVVVCNLNKEDEEQEDVKVDDEEIEDDVSWLTSTDMKESLNTNNKTNWDFDDEDDYVPTEADIAENMADFNLYEETK